jgi:uncharacterized protein involved in response to NO
LFVDQGYFHTWIDFMQINITGENGPVKRFALFDLGFRPFFLGAGLYAVISVALWMLIMGFGLPVELAIPALSWHAHEMLYGYSMAIIAGFLLTAVRNWTERQTPTGLLLFVIFLFWLLARIMPVFAFAWAVPLMAFFDLLFAVSLIVAISIPVIQARAWRQLAIIGKVVFLLIGNICFYAGLFGLWDNGVHFGLYFGLYLIIALILTMLRRLIPFFTERGVGYSVTLTNRRWLDISSVIIFLVFFVCDLFFYAPRIAAASALILFVLHGIRFYGWYTPGILRKPLLWSLYAGYGFIIIGFPLYAAAVFLNVTPFAATHAFAYGGIGIITLSMISRVSLGHTGRDIHAAPRFLATVLILLVLGALIRVFPVLISPAHYTLYIVVSQLLWMLSFGGFVWIYAPILMRPRVDGQPG